MSLRPERTPVAGDLFTYCTKEKTDTWHVVRNHNAQGVVDRVICKSCGSDHKFRFKIESSGASTTQVKNLIVRRGTPGGISVSTTTKTSPTPTSSTTLKNVWFDKIKKWGLQEPLAYNPDFVFEEGQVLKHISFGKGVVERLRGSRMDVLFESGLKTLPTKKKVLEF